MTVCVAVRVHDCIVFATDSASTLSRTGPDGNEQVVNVFGHGDKIFNLYRGLPICAMTAGIGSMGGRSIASLAKDLRARFHGDDAEWKIDLESYSIEWIAQKARSYILDDVYQGLSDKPPGGFEFWIGGYSAGSNKHELWKIGLDAGTPFGPQRLSSNGDCGLDLGGQPDPVARLVLGFGIGLPDALRKAGMPDAQVAQLVAFLQSELTAPLVSESMPIQDAINLAEFFVDTTKAFYRFLPGADVVGGATDIAVVTRHEGFKWIKRKHYYPAHLNPMETDHVR